MGGRKMDKFKYLINDKAVFHLEHKDDVGILDTLHTPDGPKEVIRRVHETKNSKGKSEYFIYNYHCMTLESLPTSYIALLKREPGSEAIKSVVVESIKSLDNDLEKYLILTRMLYFCRNEVEWYARLNTEYMPPGNDAQRATVIAKRAEKAKYAEELHTLSQELAKLRREIDLKTLIAELQRQIEPRSAEFHPLTTYKGVLLDPFEPDNATEWKSDSLQASQLNKVPTGKISYDPEKEDALDRALRELAKDDKKRVILPYPWNFDAYFGNDLITQDQLKDREQSGKIDIRKVEDPEIVGFFRWLDADFGTQLLSNRKNKKLIRELFTKNGKNIKTNSLQKAYRRICDDNTCTPANKADRAEHDFRHYSSPQNFPDNEYEFDDCGPDLPPDSPLRLGWPDDSQLKESDDIK
jgi:hypothetical protein